MSMLVALAFNVSAIAGGSGFTNPEKSEVSVRKIDDKKVQLVFGKVPEGIVIVRIFNENNILVQTDKIVSKEAFAKYYDFSKVASERYTVQVSDGRSIVNQAEIMTGSGNKAPVVYSKLDKVEENKYKLLINALLPSNMTVSVYENDRLVHIENLIGTSGFEKVYVLNQKLPGSKVEFYVTTNDGFSKLMAVK
jgi:hypothetical protein